MKELKYYGSSKEATLFSFRNVIETGDVRYLLILDDYKELPDIDDDMQDKLMGVWDSINDEFQKASDSSGSELRFAEQKRLTAKRLKLGYLSITLAHIAKFNDEEVAEELKDDGININFDDTESFNRSIQKAISTLNRMKLQLKQAERTMETGDDESGDINELISELEKFQGYEFRDEMKVNKFFSILKRYKDHGRQD